MFKPFGAHDMKIVDQFVRRFVEKIVATNVLQRQAAHILHGPLITEVSINKPAVRLHIFHNILIFRFIT
jgi:hypothetical protein